jgi:two-component system sensor histidine kinase RpfC
MLRGELNSSSNNDAQRGCLGIWRKLRQRLHNRPDSEHEQILIRVGFAAVIMAYLAFLVDGGDASSVRHACLVIGAIYAVGSVLLLLHVIWRPETSALRRIAGMLLDLSCLPAGMIVGEAWVAPFYPMFLWITFGMGFRFGERYLFASAGLGVIGFGSVIALTDFWGSQPVFSATLLVALVVLPAYAWTLLKKLTGAVERAEQANRAKSRFVASMSHELRTPLNAIIGMSDLLNVERLSQQQRDMARTIKTAGQTLLDMVDDVLNIAQIEAENVAKANVDFDLHALLAAVRSLHHRSALEKGLDLHVHLDPDVPFRLRGNDRSLRQILVNLVTNAIKFTESGRVVIHVSLDKEAGDRVWLAFGVEDTGCGIAPEDQEKVFERFYQTDRSVSQETGGAGLGLAIARQLTDLLEGRLSVRSQVGRGSQFCLVAPFERLALPEPSLRGHVFVLGDARTTAPICRQLSDWGADVVRIAEPFGMEALAETSLDGQQALVVVVSIGSSGLPRAMEAVFDRMTAAGCSVVLVGDRPFGDRYTYLTELGHEPSAPDLFSATHAALALPSEPDERRSSERSDHRRAGARILLTEDNPVNRKVLAKMLSYGGYQAMMVTDGEAMLDALESEPFDLVLFDLNMPGINGLEAFQLYRFGSSDKDTPFLALTADATEESRQRCMDAGIDGYLTKPVQLEQLLDAIDGLMAPEKYEKAAALDETVVRHPRYDAQLPTVDQSCLERLRALSQGDDFLAEVLKDFIEDTESLVIQFELAVTSGDEQAFRDTAHALRSSAAYIGAKRLVDLCLGWRGVTHEDMQRDGIEHLKRLKAEVTRLRGTLIGVIEGDVPDAKRS